MKKTVLTFGLISGLIMSVLMDSSVLLADKLGAARRTQAVLRGKELGLLP